jgi:outer membrane protein assembly factor BamE
MDVAQGNEVTQEMVDQLRPGMTQSQVRYVMGTPLLTDTFNQNRWDYIYQMVEEDERTDKRRVTLYFENNRLVRLEGDLQPGAQ